MEFDPTLRLTLQKCMNAGDDFCIYSWKRYKNPIFDLKTRSWKEKDAVNEGTGQEESQRSKYGRCVIPTRL